MNCLVAPVSLIRRSRSTGYRVLTKDGLDQESRNTPVTVVVGKEKRVFLVDPFILQQNPFRILMDTFTRKDPDPDPGEEKGRSHFRATRTSNGQRRVIFVDNVDAILFEHMLWLFYNDCPSLFNLNLNEILDFYAQDI